MIGRLRNWLIAPAIAELKERMERQETLRCVQLEHAYEAQNEHLAEVRVERIRLSRENEELRAELAGPFRVVVQVDDAEPDRELLAKYERPLGPGTVADVAWLERGGRVVLIMNTVVPFRAPIVSVVQGPGLLGAVELGRRHHLVGCAVSCRCSSPWTPAEQLRIEVIGTAPPRGA